VLEVYVEVPHPAGGGVHEKVVHTSDPPTVATEDGPAADVRLFPGEAMARETGQRDDPGAIETVSVVHASSLLRAVSCKRRTLETKKPGTREPRASSGEGWAV
jgi:hypothetical protein